jgi:Fe-S-cluster containining protein
MTTTLTFPCTKCGACCRHVNLSPLTAYLDRGDGIATHSLCRAVYYSS